MYLFSFSGRCHRLLHLLGSVSHSAPDVDLRSLGGQVDDRHPEPALLRLWNSLLRQLRHQPHPLQHHVPQVPKVLPDDPPPTMLPPRPVAAEGKTEAHLQVPQSYRSPTHYARPANGSPLNAPTTP